MIPYTVRNVKNEVRKAIALYCKENGIHQCTYLATDKRLKKYLEVMHS